MNKSDNTKIPGDTCAPLAPLSRSFQSQGQSHYNISYVKAIRLLSLPSDWDTMAAACKQGVEGAKKFKNVGSTPALLSCDP